MYIHYIYMYVHIYIYYIILYIYYNHPGVDFGKHNKMGICLKILFSIDFRMTVYRYYDLHIYLQMI